jgi:hypothetical protein
MSRIVVFRALALGAWVAVFTSRPEMWHGLGGWATGRDERVTVMPIEQQLTVTATARQPVLFLYDDEVLAPAQRPDLGPWQAQLTVLRQLTSYGSAAVQEANLVALARLSADEVTAAGSCGLRLRPTARTAVGELGDDMLAVVAGDSPVYVSVAPTRVELAQFGPPAR